MLDQKKKEQIIATSKFSGSKRTNDIIIIFLTITRSSMSVILVPARCYPNYSG